MLRSTIYFHGFSSSKWWDVSDADLRSRSGRDAVRGASRPERDPRSASDMSHHFDTRKSIKINGGPYTVPTTKWWNVGIRIGHVPPFLISRFRTPDAPPFRCDLGHVPPFDSASSTCHHSEPYRIRAIIYSIGPIDLGDVPPFAVRSKMRRERWDVGEVL